jgi:hypothetical protein
MGTKELKIVCSEEKIFCTGPTREAKAQQKYQKGPPLFVLFESPFTSVSTAPSRGHPSLVSLAIPTYFT